jgi:Mrp family chromosome partitioning ATPase
VADTATFASRLDAMVLLCRSRKLTRAVVQRAAVRLRSCGANMIGSVLNADRPRWTSAVHGYEYEYSTPRPRAEGSSRQRRGSQPATG